MSDYDDLLKAARGGPLTLGAPDPAPQADQFQLRGTLLDALDTTPDEAAKVVRLADRTGIPAPVIRLNPKPVQVRADINDWDKMLSGAPALRQWMRDPLNAALSTDEMDKLARTESLWRDVGDVLRALPGGAVETAGQTIQGFGDLYGAVSRGLVRATDMGLSAVGLPTIQDLDKRIGVKVDPRVTPQGMLRFAGQPLVDVGRAIGPPEERHTLLTDISAGVGQIGTQIVGMLLSGGTAGTSMLFAQGANQLEESARKAGKSGTPEGDAAVMLGGAITAVSEKLGFDALMHRAQPAVRNAVMRRLLDVAAAGGIEAVEEVIENVLQNLTERAYLDPNAPIFEGLDRQAAAAGGAGAIARALLTAITPGRQHVRQRSIAEQSTAQINAFDQWMKETGGSALLERAPDRFGQLVDQIAPDARVYLPAEKVVEFFQSMPTEKADALARQWGIADQIERAVATGGDVVMTVGQYRQHVEQAQAHEYFKMDLRLTPGGMSLNEAKTFDESYKRFVEQQQANPQKGVVDQTPGQMVYADVVAKAREAGFTEDVARQYAALYAARYQSRGQRLGTDAFAAYQRSGLELRRVMPESVRRVPPDQMDLLLDAWRKGKPAESQRKIMGPSLLEFVSDKGGLVDDGGELAAMDADKWHKGKPGVRRLVQDKAKLSADDMALSAWENGYFPEFTERPTIDDLHEAMREELAGRKRHIADNTRDWRAGYAQALADLEEMSSRAGFSKTDSNAKIKQAIAKLETDAGGYAQPDGAGFARGKIAFTDGRSIISLFAHANLSTFLHETGHLWLEELRADSVDAQAQQQVRDDWAAVEKFLGVKPGEAPTVDQHERWARAVETYLMEGRAPSIELGGTFQRFKSWLVSIYRTVAGLQSPINDEIRQVMDHLIATDEQIDLARTELQAQQLFASADQMGGTEAEFAAYTDSVQRARSTAETDLLKQVMGDIRRRRTREWNEERAKVRAEVRDGLMAWTGEEKPVDHLALNALHYLRTGKLADGSTPDFGRMRLSKDAILDMYGAPTVLDALPPRIVTDKGNAHPDLVAERLGFTDGRAMIDALMLLEQEQRAMKAAGDGRSVRAKRIDEETDRIMRERHGDTLSDGSIQREALDAIHNEDQLKVLATELRALSRKAGIEPSPLAVIRRFAADTIASQPVHEATDVALHRRAEAKAGKAVLDAVLAGDHEEAFRQKQRQMIAHAMYIEAKDARELVEKGQRLMDRYANARALKAMDQEYLEQIHGLLERFSFATESRKATDRRVSLRDFAARMEEQGVDVAIPEALLDEAQRRHYSEISVSEFRGLYDSVRQIAHLGRLKKELTVNKEKREFDATVGEAVDTISSTPQRGGGGDDRGMTSFERKFGRAGDLLRGADASLLKIETMVDWLDGGNSNGTMNRVVFRPMAEAQAAERKLQKEKLEGFAKLMKALPEGTVDRWQEKVTLPELPTTDGKPSIMLRSRLVAMALNMGNEGNRAKLLKGEGWEAEAVDRVLARELRVEDWDFVQGTWDLIETLWPQIAELERRVNGVEPEKVEARKVETPHGTYNGGYYPLVYDPRRSFDVDARAQKTTDQLFENNYTRATTPKGFTKERTEGYARPLWLDLEVIPRHITEVIHDVTHREAIMQADRFLADKRVREAIEGALGREYYKQFRPWLQSMANEWAHDSKGLAFWEGLMKQARLHMTLVGMGFRATTVLAQLGGFSDSTERIGARAVASGVKTFLQNPAAAHAFVTGKSDEMAARFNQVDQSIRDNVRDLVDKRGLLNDAKRFAFYGIGMMDMAVSAPTWIGAYEVALREGMDDADAVYAADKAVRDSQGSGATKDLPAVSRKNEFWRLTTMFYSYFSHMYQRQRQLGRDLREADSVGDFAMIAARSFWLLVVPALFGAWAGGQGPEDDEDLGAWAARKVLFNLPMGIPILRDLASGVENSVSGKFRGSYSFTPAARIGETGVRLSGDMINLVREGEVHEGFLKRAIELPGYVLGLPTGQLGTTAQYLWDVLVDRDQSPKSIKDWLDGLIYGPEKKR